MPIGSNIDITNRTMGIAAADLPHDSRELYVHVPQFTPYQEGELIAIEASNDINTTNSDSSTSASSYTGSLKTTNFIKCYWQGDANNPYPPAIRKGEQVTVYSIGDTDMWYWTVDGRDEDQRRLDTKRISVSGSLDNITDRTDDNTYYLELDTLRNKHIKLSTSDADEETYRYVLCLDAGNSKVTITDNDNNTIAIESSDTPKIYMRNSKNSMVLINDKSITIACEDDISIKSTNGKILLSAKGNIYGVSSSGDITTKASGTNRMMGSSGVVVSSRSSVRIETPNTCTIAVGHLSVVSYSGSVVDWGRDYV